jgi:hypothetical protein
LEFSSLRFNQYSLPGVSVDEIMERVGHDAVIRPYLDKAQGMYVSEVSSYELDKRSLILLGVDCILRPSIIHMMQPCECFENTGQAPA